MLPNVRAALQEQRARSQLRSDFIFPSETGGPLDLTNLRERNWRRVIRKSGLRKRTLYQCRHSYAALQLSRGENPQYVAHQMRHTTLERSSATTGAGCGSRRESDASPSNLPPNSRQVCQKFARKWPDQAPQAPAPQRADSSQTIDSIGRKGGAGNRGGPATSSLGRARSRGTTRRASDENPSPTRVSAIASLLHDLWISPLFPSK